jgi:hypothetical protein
VKDQEVLTRRNPRQGERTIRAKGKRARVQPEQAIAVCDLQPASGSRSMRPRGFSSRPVPRRSASRVLRDHIAAADRELKAFARAELIGSHSSEAHEFDSREEPV